MTDDLITWLRAQLDDDERSAPEVHAASCLAVDSSGGLYAVSPDSCTCGWPRRLLAEVDAKRRIIAELARLDGDPVNGLAITEIIRLLAQPYADRSGYREDRRS